MFCLIMHTSGGMTDKHTVMEEYYQGKSEGTKVINTHKQHVTEDCYLQHKSWRYLIFQRKLKLHL